MNTQRKTVLLILGAIFLLSIGAWFFTNIFVLVRIPCSSQSGCLAYRGIATPILFVSQRSHRYLIKLSPEEDKAAAYYSSTSILNEGGTVALGDKKASKVILNGRNPKLTHNSQTKSDRHHVLFTSLENERVRILIR